MWADLVQAYESKLAVLEEARAAYSEAVTNVVAHAAPSMEEGVLEGLRDAATGYRVEAVVSESGDNASFALAPWSCITIADDEVGTQFRIAAWVASSWGGPVGVLRIVLSLEAVHSGLERREWVARSRGLLEDSLPGESYASHDSQRFADLEPDWPIIRVAGVQLENRDYREVASEAYGVTRVLAQATLPLLESIREAGLALSVAEGALMRYRPTLEARAEPIGAPVYPARGLGPWQGGKFLQVGSFWLATNPETNALMAAAKNDEDVVMNLSEEWGLPTSRRGGRLAVTLLSEEQLRSPNCEIDAAVARAFGAWFHTKSHEVHGGDLGEGS